MRVREKHSATAYSPCLPSCLHRMPAENRCFARSAETALSCVSCASRRLNLESGRQILHRVLPEICGTGGRCFPGRKETDGWESSVAADATLPADDLSIPVPSIPRHSVFCIEPQTNIVLH